MADIFISYTEEDREYAAALDVLFREVGWSVWWDRDIPIGRTFDDVIEEEIDAAQCVVVIWSSRSVGSEWVRVEAAEGAARRILAPVQVEDVKLPLAFRRIQTAKLLDWSPGQDHPEKARLIRAVKRLVPTSTNGPHEAEFEIEERQDDPARLRRQRARPRLVASLAVDGATSAINPTEDAVWISDLYSGQVTRVDASSNALERIAVDTELFDLKCDGDEVWVGAWRERRGKLYCINAGSREVRLVGRVGEGPDAIAVGEGQVWVVGTDSKQARRIDPVDGSQIADRALVRGVSHANIAFGKLWLTSYDNRKLYGHSLSDSGKDVRIPLDFAPWHMNVGEGGVWIGGHNRAAHFDPVAGQITEIDADFSGFVATAAGGGFGWLSDRRGNVALVDPESRTVIAVETFGFDQEKDRGGDMTVCKGALWVLATDFVHRVEADT